MFVLEPVTVFSWLPLFFVVFAVGPTVNGWEGRGFTGLYTGPYFDTSTPTNITAQLGTHAFLPCKVKQLGNKSVRTPFISHSHHFHRHSHRRHHRLMWTRVERLLSSLFHKHDWAIFVLYTNLFIVGIQTVCAFFSCLPSNVI